MDEQAPKPPAPANRRITPSRIVLLVLLAIAVCALAVDMTARRSAERAKAQLDDAIDEVRGGKGAEKTQTPTPEQVHTLLGRQPDAGQARPDVEIYTWQGALQTYRVYVRYAPGETPTLREVSLNQPLY